MKVRLIWINGNANVCGDDRVKDQVNDWIYEAHGEDFNLRVSQETVLNQFRIARKKGIISDLEVIYNGKIIRCDQHGTLDGYPDGFACLAVNQLLELL